MIKTLTTICAAALLLAVCSAPAADLQSGSDFTVTNVFTQNFLPPSTATNVGIVIDVRNFDQIGFQLSCVASNPAAVWNAAGKETITVWASESADGVRFGPPKYPIGGVINTNAAYPTMVFPTNLSVGAMGFIRLDWFTNTMTISHVTNNQLVVTRKRSYRGP